MEIPFTKKEIQTFEEHGTLDEMYEKHKNRFYPFCLVGLELEKAREQSESYYGKNNVELIPPGIGTCMDSRGIVKYWVELDKNNVITQIST